MPTAQYAWDVVRGSGGLFPRLGLLLSQKAIKAVRLWCEAVAEEGVETPGLLSLVLNSLYALDKLGKPETLVKGQWIFHIGRS